VPTDLVGQRDSDSKERRLVRGKKNVCLNHRDVGCVNSIDFGGGAM